ncbi:MAG: Dihydroorotate dehydrogenase B (NAD(+)), catalytic subunit [Acidobacteria bacterium ADurb.Bin340]|nr:MAG: Dihydroorotate dehydrogenase B (NAD(+)), catalytic subunit [Acidobacteria bacterium ADurb.Bin340]
MINLSTTYLGLKLPSPVIVGSCGLTKSLKALQACEAAGAGAVVLKSIFEEQILAEAEGQVPDEEGGLFHSEAYEYLQEYGEENALAASLSLIREAKRCLKIPVIASVNCRTSNRWEEFIHRLEKAGADAIELNINLLSSDARLAGPELEARYEELLAQVRETATVPVALKLGYHFSALAAFLFRLSHSGPKGLVLFNRPFFPDFDVEKLELTTGRYLSSPTEYQMPLRWISLTSGRLGCDVCAATGIHSGETAVKLILAGAHAVQVVSVLYEHGIESIGRMNEEIRLWMQRHDCQRIEDFRGRLRQVDSPNPAAYERVQFMRHTAGIE